MRQYFVQADAFFSQNLNPSLRSYFECNSALCQPAIQQLIASHALAGKSVLSVGSKVGHEEVWFYRAGCPLTLCDIDEHQDIEPMLRQLPSGGLTYYIGDARDLPPPAKFDVIYLSSFTPDELHKRDVRKANMHLLVYLLRRLHLSTKQEYRWPVGTDAFSPLVASLLHRAAMMILQSYASPVRADDPDYQQAATRQLTALGFASIDLYFQQHWPSTHLLVASRQAAFPRQPISRIHGRGTNRDDQVIYRRLAPL